MRECLLGSFSEIYILNLHGSSRRGERAPENINDENVFDIQQGVAIGIFIKKKPDKSGPTSVHYADMWGLRGKKYLSLNDSDIATTEWSKEFSPSPPHFFFVPKDFSLREEYSRGEPLKEIFTVWQNGLKTDRDELFFDFDSHALEERMRTFFGKNYGEDFKEKYRVLPSSSFDIEARREQAAFDKEHIKRCLYRPFDARYLYYDPKLTSRPAYEVMRHMLQANKALIATRQTSDPFAVLVTKTITGHKSMAAYDINSVFPLCLYPAEGEMQFGEGDRRPNLNPQFIKAVSEKSGLRFIEAGKGDLQQTFGPEDIFNYAYAVFHSPTYRTRYAEFLKIDFPRLPLTSHKELFKALVEKGAELVALHLMESPLLDDPHNFITRYRVSGSNMVDKVRYNEITKRVHINKEQYFEGITPDIWNFHIGGYQVCQKWLKDRKGRSITNELTHYQKVVVALKETIRLMEEIDGLIPRWPVE